MKPTFLGLFCTFFSAAWGQVASVPNLGQLYEQAPIDARNLRLDISAGRGDVFQVGVLQQGIDLELLLLDETGQQLQQKDSPNGKHGIELMEFEAPTRGTYSVVIRRFDEAGNPTSGVLSYFVREVDGKEQRRREADEKALAIEHQKVSLTADVDHFWEMWDVLKTCTSTSDSLVCIQSRYLDRATDGLKEFITARNLHVFGMLQAIRREGKFYDEVRARTEEVKKAEPIIKDVYDSLGSLYDGFKRFRVCFYIGAADNGGSTLNGFVLISAELTCTGDPANIPQRIKGIVAHECVHTQQAHDYAAEAIVCPQLYTCLREGSANFIGEMVSGTHNYNDTYQYGEAHEGELWVEFKSTLCFPDGSKWVYNGDTAHDRPADLGYYVGYKIVQAYYEAATDKKKAIRDIIESRDPLALLQKSCYDCKFR